MTHFINAVRADGPSLIIQIKSDLPEDILAEHIKTAVKNFLADGGPEARNAMQATSGQFNWGDLALWLPAKYAMDQDFEILDATVAGMTVIHDENLLPRHDPCLG